MTSSAPAPALASSPPADEPTSGVEQVMLLILALTLASTCLLTSAGEGAEEGHVPWGRNSILRVITDLTNLTHQFPTARGTEVKWLTQAAGAAAALVCAAAAWFLRTRRDPDAEPFRPEPLPPRPFAWLRGMSPSTAAQVALVLFVGWAALSALWSPWTESSIYEAMRLGMGALLAISIGHCLTRRMARHGAVILAVVLIVTAAIGIWYHYERNPVQRLKYPIGNPIFFAACLLPAFPVLAAVILGEVFAVRRTGKPGSPPLRSILIIAAGALGLVLLGWAFVLADSRGPGLGLILGLLAAALLLTPMRTRLVLLAGGTVALIMFASLKLWPVSWLLSRPDTVRLRLYAWKYALNLFLSRPDIGRGQGAYVLLAQQMSRPDAERDPLAFPGGNFLGNAHNEWLEILADLGAVGLALMITAIGVTLWAVLLAWRQSGATAESRPAAIRDRCMLAGLLGAFLGLIAESTSDVALRMPGLPVILYATWGLLWAMSRPASARPPVIRVPGVRAVGLVAAIAGAWLVLVVAGRDWHAALAEPQVARYAGQFQWEKALQAADECARYRLGLEARLGAFYRATSVARDAAAFTAHRLQDMIQRAGQPLPESGDGPHRRDMSAITRLAEEDVANFERYFDLGVRTGQTLLAYCPTFPNVAAFISDLWLLRSQIAGVQTPGGPLPLASLPTDPLEQARLWMLQEFRADRLSAELGLRLLQLSHGQDMLERLNMLRIPIRTGPIHPGVEPALIELMQEDSFGSAIEALLAAARPATLSSGNWPDPYSPESMRLAALAYKRRGMFEQAALLAGQAAQLLDQIRSRFPANAGYAMSDQAEYLLLGDPDHPERAIGAAQKALELWPESFRPQQRQVLDQSLVIYLLAAGAEAEGRQIIAAILVQDASSADVERSLGLAYLQLCQRFMPFVPEKRPPKLKDWLQRSLVLATGRPEPLMLATTVTLEAGQEDVAIQNLQTLEQMVQNPEAMAVFLRSLLARFPSSPGLKSFAATRLPEFGQTTQPAQERPAATSQPAAPATRSPNFFPNLE